MPETHQESRVNEVAKQFLFKLGGVPCIGNVRMGSDGFEMTTGLAASRRLFFSNASMYGNFVCFITQW